MGVKKRVKKLTREQKRAVWSTKTETNAGVGWHSRKGYRSRSGPEAEVNGKDYRPDLPLDPIEGEDES